MSNFLLNLLRRGAGLPSIVAPRMPDLPSDLLGRVGSEILETESAGGTPNLPTSRMVRSSDAQTISVSPSGRVRPSREERPTVPDAQPERPVERTESSRVALHTEALTESNTAPRTERARPLAPSPEESRPREASSVVSAVKHTTPEGRPPRDQDAATFPAPPEHSASRRVDAPTGTVVPARQPLSALLPPSAIGMLREGEQVSDRDEREPEPHIEVRIGRIEIRPPAAAPPPMRATRRPPRGFQTYASARRALDRRWY